MRNVFGMLAVLMLVAAVMISCENSVPKVNGKNVLTLEQYNKLMAAMQSKNSVTGTANGDNGQKLSAMDEGMALFRAGQYAQAVTAFQTLVNSEPQNSQAWFMLGNSFEKAGQLSQAQSAYKTSYDLLVKKGYIPEVGSMM